MGNYSSTNRVLHDMTGVTRQMADNEESILQGLLVYFSKFSYDKAKEQADKERDLSRFSGSPVWQSLLSCVAQLASVEKLYMNLSFLTAKGFLRKESSVRASYESLNLELSELGSERRRGLGTNGNPPPTSSGAPGSPCCDGILRHLCSHLVLFIKARLQMIAFYEKLLEASMCRLMNFEELLSQVTEIGQKNSRNFHHPILTPIKTNFTYECDILIHLLRSQLEMQHWRFLPSLIHLHDAHSKLNSWHSAIQPKEGVGPEGVGRFKGCSWDRKGQLPPELRPKPKMIDTANTALIHVVCSPYSNVTSPKSEFFFKTKKYGFGSSFLKSSPLPVLYQWLWQTKAAFVSKFSLYFHETLAAQSSPAEMKALISRQGQACDYVSKIQSFQRKSDAVSVCLVFEAAGIEDYQGAGYHHPQELLPAPKGLDSYPAIFSYPSNKCQDRWPSIVMRITDRSNEAALLDGVVCFFDQQNGPSWRWSKLGLPRSLACPPPPHAASLPRQHTCLPIITATDKEKFDE
ncbi:KICSTOR subunit 2-like isoform X2 [Eriocheir sinensis]|uniref:KICSTOR subunit 2-like isoform X2 n=1 Tax=Eriocheir sinensis TaxID=95602 RepID=UPI0021CAC6BB|nr:KICSTOR subunit 2-like isoform X2 [Eriocheir sinensis]